MDTILIKGKIVDFQSGEFEGRHYATLRALVNEREYKFSTDVRADTFVGKAVVLSCAMRPDKYQQPKFKVVDIRLEK